VRQGVASLHRWPIGRKQPARYRQWLRSQESSWVSLAWRRLPYRSIRAGTPTWCHDSPADGRVRRVTHCVTSALTAVINLGLLAQAAKATEALPRHIAPMARAAMSLRTGLRCTNAPLSGATQVLRLKASIRDGRQHLRRRLCATASANALAFAFEVTKMGLCCSAANLLRSHATRQRMPC
jgi:hypothetical protein